MHIRYVYNLPAYNLQNRSLIDPYLLWDRAYQWLNGQYSVQLFDICLREVSIYLTLVGCQAIIKTNSMKKTITLITIVIGALCSINANAQKDITESGFYMHVGGMFPTKTFATIYISDGPNMGALEGMELAFGPAPELEIGNMFSITDNNEYAIGIKATWLSASYTTMDLNDSLSIAYIPVSVGKVGPYFTYALNNDMAVDLSYQVSPTVLIGTSSDAMMSFGVAHTLGAAFRLKALLIGADFNFGGLIPDVTFNEDPNTYRVATTNFRLFIGFKI